MNTSHNNDVLFLPILFEVSKGISEGFNFITKESRGSFWNDAKTTPETLPLHDIDSIIQKVESTKNKSLNDFVPYCGEYELTFWRDVMKPSSLSGIHVEIVKSLFWKRVGPRSNHDDDDDSEDDDDDDSEGDRQSDFLMEKIKSLHKQHRKYTDDDDNNNGNEKQLEIPRELETFIQKFIQKNTMYASSQNYPWKEHVYKADVFPGSERYRSNFFKLSIENEDKEKGNRSSSSSSSLEYKIPFGSLFIVKINDKFK